MTTYAAYNLNEDIKKNSSSGGVFYSLAKYILDQNGIVFGAAWNKDWLVDMCYINKLEDLPKLMGSKYVKADNKDTFKECKEFLDSGKQVLYSGTPCQIFALKIFLKKDYANLLTVEVACEGTMPTIIWKDYLETIQRPGHTITSIKMRDKENTTWNHYNFTIKYDDGKVFKEDHNKNKFFSVFLSAKYMNKSCINCKAKNNSGADITIGDWWCIEHYHKNLDSTDGVSFIRINTNNGLQIFNNIKNNFKLEVTNIENIKKHNSGIRPINDIKQEVYNKNIFKKKVAIVTMNLHFNIGTALQAYALQKTIINAGYDCDVITWARKDRLQFCDKYIKMKILPTAQDYDKIKESDYDIFVVGSDQIWRKNTSLKDYKENYINYPFLGFTTNWSKVRFSYATSFGTSWQYTDVEDKKLTSILKQFNALSTRELSSVVDCKDRLGLEFEQHVDPTMLLNKEDYLKLCSNIVINNNKNIFKYILHETADKTNFIDKKAKELGWPVVTHDKSSVLNWLSKIRDASLVITDSFHGVIFSIIFNKPFIYWNTRDGGSSRFETIEKLFGIQNRQIKDNFIITNELLEPANINLKDDRQKSLDYILKNLAAIPQKLTINLAQNKLNWQQNRKQAWMLFLSSDNYIYYVLNVYKNLLDCGTKYAVCCGYTEAVSQKTIEILNKCGLITFKLDTKSILHENIKLKGISNWIKAFAKLGLLKNQLNLDKMIYLDSDLGIYSNIDELMSKPHMSAVQDGLPLPQRPYGPYKVGDSVFCSGLFIWDFKNNNTEADHILNNLNKLPKNIDWHDQNVLNYFYQNWQDKPELHLAYTYGLMTTKEKFNLVKPTRGLNWPKVIHYIAGQGEKTKMPFTTEKMRLFPWCQLQAVIDYYKEINISISQLMQLYNFELPLINIENIISVTPEKDKAKQEEEQKDKRADGRANTYLYF